MGIPGSANPLLLTNKQQYLVQRSLRFNSSDSAYCSRVFSSAGNRKTWTWSGWVKLSKLGINRYLFGSSTDGFNANYGLIYIHPGDYLIVNDYVSAHRINLQTTQLFRDPSAWYHIVVNIDTTQAAASDRCKIYVNNVQITAFGTATYPSLNADLFINNTNTHYLSHVNTSTAFDGYLADIHFIDGQALTPSSFAETNATTGQWVPKAFSGGSYGTNGFKLTFSDNSNNTATTLGKDTSPNGNNWTPLNLNINQVTDLYSPTSNTNLFGMTWAQVFKPSNTAGVYSLDNTTATGTLRKTKSYSSSVELLCCSTDGSAPIYANGVAVTSPPIGNNISSAAWRTVLTGSGTLSSVAVQSNGVQRGILFQIRVDGTQLVDLSASDNDSLVDTPTSYGTDAGNGGEVRGNYCTLNPLASAGTMSNGNLDGYNAVNTTSHATFAMPSAGKWYFEATLTAGAAFNLGLAAYRPGGHVYTITNSVLYSSSGVKNVDGVLDQAYGASFTTGDVIGVACDADAASVTFYKNGVSQGAISHQVAGLFPSFGNGGVAVNYTVNFGQRPFAYPVSGFKALCDTNLPTPVVAKPSTVMDVKLYTGNGGTQSITGLGFSPDLVWIKARNSAQTHVLMDTVRGTSSQLFSNLTNAEGTQTDQITAFNSDGFSLGANVAGTGGVNTNAVTYAGWAWDAGSSNSTNTQGSITTTVRANTSAGFSIATATAHSSAPATYGHGLGAKPGMIIVKSRTFVDVWYVYHQSLGATKNIWLEQTAAATTNGAYWNNTEPTSTVFTMNNAMTNIGNIVAYCWAPVAGYSSFGSYVGNGSTDGVFQWCGFRPRWLLIKSSSGATENWVLIDSARDTYNVAGTYLLPNLANAEGSSLPVDFLSNGFKLRGSGGTNQSAVTYIYAAFAENPFQYARAR